MKYRCDDASLGASDGAHAVRLQGIGEWVQASGYWHVLVFDRSYVVALAEYEVSLVSVRTHVKALTVSGNGLTTACPVSPSPRANSEYSNVEQYCNA
jgi:hypothetical protein